MASIFRKPNSPFWFAAYRDVDGQRRQKTTKTKNRGQAIDMARAWERLGESGRKGTLTEAVARSVVAQLVEQATGSPLHFYTCRAWLEEWLVGKVGTTSAGTLTRYRQVIADFMTFLGPRADLGLAAISPTDVRAFRDHLSAGKRAPSTVNLQIKKVLNVPFAAASKFGFIPLNPCAAVESLRVRDSEGRENFSEEQIRQLVMAAEGDWQGAVLAGYYTGLRLGDVANLNWEAVDLQNGLLRLKTTKTGAAVTMPLHEELKRWLCRQNHRTAKAPVFPTLADKRSGGAGGLSAQFAKLLQRASITRKELRSGEGAGHRTSNLSFHSLRHSFVSALANAGVAPDVRRKLSGHADERIHARYSHHEIEIMRAAVAKVPNVRA